MAGLGEDRRFDILPPTEGVHAGRKSLSQLKDATASVFQETKGAR